jgi:hypothetical protein
MKFYPDTLTRKQRAILPIVARAVEEYGFYLAGGTAIALQLGHRRSDDFDWFTPKRVSDYSILIPQIQQLGFPLEIESHDRASLYTRINGVKASFIEFSFPMLKRVVRWKSEGVAMASLDDLAGMKLAAVAQRGAKKDFIDLFALLEKHRPLNELLSLYQKKFSIRDIGHVLRATTYFDDAERQRMPSMIWGASWLDVKDAIKRQAKEFAA